MPSTARKEEKNRKSSSSMTAESNCSITTIEQSAPYSSTQDDPSSSYSQDERQRHDLSSRNKTGNKRVRLGSSLPLRRLPINRLLKPLAPDFELTQIDEEGRNKYKEDYDDDDDDDDNNNNESLKEDKIWNQDTDDDYSLSLKMSKTRQRLRSITARRSSAGGREGNNRPSPSCASLIAACFQTLCLSPRLNLKTQLCLSFGSVNVILILFVVICCCSAAYIVGETVKNINQKNFDTKLVGPLQAVTVRYLTETLEKKFLTTDVIDIIVEATKDRFEGYPNTLPLDNSTEQQVPFKDIISGRNIYPIIGPKDMPLNWQIQATVNESNYLEHVGEHRWKDFFQSKSAVSTANAAFLMQGACDPNVYMNSNITDDETETVTTSTQRSQLPFWMNCTDANNNVETGGAIHPLPSTFSIYNKSSDLVPLLKALHESSFQIQDIGIYFANMGVGASVTYPAYPIDIEGHYSSSGCDWMEAPNPIDSSLGPIAFSEEISYCHPKGEMVSVGLYNPLERGWCQNQALNPNKHHITAIPDGWHPGKWILSIGRAIYDRQTKRFLACTHLTVSLTLLQQLLEDAVVTDNSVLSLIRFDEVGTVIVTTAALAYDTSSSATIDELGVGLSNETYQMLYSLIEFESSDSQQIRMKFEEFSALRDGFLVKVSPLPLPTEDPSYKPEFLVVMSSSTEDVFKGVGELNEDVNNHVKVVFWFSLVAGGIGFIFTTVIILCMAHSLTSPLNFINEVADDIVNSFGGHEHDTHGEKDSDLGSNGIGGDNDLDIEGSQSSDRNSKNVLPTVKKKERTAMAVRKDSEYFKSRFSPRTELTDVLDEFNQMVASFSGSLLAKSEKSQRVEVINRFDLQDEFASLYQSRKDPGFSYDLGAIIPAVTDLQKAADTGDGTPVFNVASNMKFTEASGISNDEDSGFRRQGHWFNSRLFMWTAILIVSPLLLTTISIWAVVMRGIRYEFNDGIGHARDFYVRVKHDAHFVHAKLRAEYISSLAGVSVRDLHLLTRYYSWLLFDGVERADTFTEMLSGTEECKYHAEDVDQCPFSLEHWTCDCAWNDMRSPTCQDFQNEGSRHLQLSDFSAQKDASLQDGDRNGTDFPTSSYSPESTSWWIDLGSVPGWEKGSSAAGYDTLYDRLRVSSAMPLLPVVFNYDHEKENFLGMHTGFDSDGLFIGYAGCGTMSQIENAAWMSTEANGAAKLRPDLCPIGKFGYDPRCRGWYDKGRKLATEKNVSLHITAPYAFAITNMYGQSATAPLMDPHTGDHVGQVLYDFLASSIFEALTPLNTPLSKGSFPILIAVQGNPEENTVIGPSFSLGDEAKEISQVVLPTDHSCQTNKCIENVGNFRTIVDSMKLGSTRMEMFTRSKLQSALSAFDSALLNLTSSPSVLPQEKLSIAYAPVTVKSTRPVDSSNFARGVETSEYLIYSLGICETEEGILEPFKHVEEDMTRQIKWANLVLAVGIIVGAFLATYLSYLVTTSIAEPMLGLLGLIRCINRSEFNGEPPKLAHSFGSSEIRSVSDAVVLLYQVVRAANNFFFAGDLEMAYRVLVDALRLFERLGNQKAVAVASNNLGNTMAVMYRELKGMGIHKHCGLTKDMIIARGMAHFHEAITLGEKAYDEFIAAEGWSHNCLDFMQHLSNRYFNRALFLLLVKDDHEEPDEILMLGMRDLEISRDMDREIIDSGEDIGLNRENRAHKIFISNLVRARGHNMLLQMGYPDRYMSKQAYPDDWELGERLDDIYNLLKVECQNQNSELFSDVNIVGRLQEVETEIMKYKMLTGHLDVAAKIAIRILYDDPFVLAEAMSTAIDVMISYLDESCSVSVVKLKLDLLGYVKKLEQDLDSVDDGSRDSTLDSLSDSVSSRLSLNSQMYQERSSRRSSSAMNWMKKRVSGFVTMEDF